MVVNTGERKPYFEQLGPGNHVEWTEFYDQSCGTAPGIQSFEICFRAR